MSKLWIFTVLFSATCCTQLQRPKADASTQRDSVSSPQHIPEHNSTSGGSLTVVEDPHRISFDASHDTLTLDDTLHMSFSSDQLLEIAVIKPDTTFMLLVSDERERDRAPLMSKKAFKKAKRLTLIPRVTKSYAYTTEYDRNIPVLDQKGWYEFRISDNMHTDHGYMEVKKIFYTNTSRKQ